MQKDEKPGMHHCAKPIIFKNAYQLRHNMTEAEIVLWDYLKGKQILDLRFRRQHPLSNYVADFYCHSAKLIVEIDGGYHDNPKQKEADLKRTLALEDLGMVVIRFTNREVVHQLEFVLCQIEMVAKKRLAELAPNP